MKVKDLHNVDDTYDVIYADPAWGFRNKNTGGSMKSGASAHYKTMGIDEIKRMPIRNITKSNAILFMWWVSSQPEEALSVVKRWGFKIKTMTGFTWVKTQKNGDPAFGMGFYTRQNAENCLIAVKGKYKVLDRSIRQTIIHPRLKHSEKPSIVREKINILCGKQSKKIELFCRGANNDGFDVWGNESIQE